MSILGHQTRKTLPAILGMAFLAALVTGLSNQANAKDQPYKVPFSLAFGKTTYDAKCAECHGQWADGTEQGPPLVHIYYEPGHHGDQMFHRAISNGVKQHHWQFGDMKPLEGIDNTQATAVIKFVRWLQEQNGIK